MGILQKFFHIFTKHFPKWDFSTNLGEDSCEGFPTGDLGGVFYEQKTGKGFYHIKELIL